MQAGTRCLGACSVADTGQGLSTSLCPDPGTNTGEIGFNFPNYSSEKIQPVPFDTQGSYEHEVSNMQEDNLGWRSKMYGVNIICPGKKVKCKMSN